MRLLIDEKGKKYLCADDELHTKYGKVQLSGTSPGDRVTSHMGHKFSVLEPRLLDLYEKMPRSGSFLLKKDLGLILAYTGVGTGDVVVDAGTGSGSMAMVIGNIVRPTGKVVSYEIREEFAEKARENVEKAGLGEWVEVINADVTDGIKEAPDVVTLDMQEAWKAVPVVHKALKAGGMVAVYNPYVEHARKVNQALKDAGFGDVNTIECIERPMEFRDQGSRPRTSPVGHTGYLTFARKI